MDPNMPYVVEDLGMVQFYSDGSIFRQNNINFPIQPVDDNSICFKDCIYDHAQNLQLRIYKPRSRSSSSRASSSNISLPIVIYIHAGGFCVGSKDWPNFHNLCMKLSSSLKAVVVSPDHRLAPEHRLPAAFDDITSAMHWLQAQALSANGDAWLTSGDVDFNQVFVMGDSSGGNVAHQLAVRIGSGSIQLDPIWVQGYILLGSFFGGVARTRSEEVPSEQVLNLETLDRLWRLCLPVEASRDHPFANPFGPGSVNLENVYLAPILVIVAGNELLKDRALDYARRLKAMGKSVVTKKFEGKEHSFFTNNPYSDDGDEVVRIIKKFMLQCSS